MTELRHEKLTYELRGAIFKVRNELKTGWTEEVYHQGMVQFLRSQGVPVESRPHKPIFHRGVEVHLFECDLIVWDLIILELKVLPFISFAAGHYAQLIHYLKCWKKDLGLLVNFAPTRVQIERLVWNEPEFRLHEDYDSIRSYLTDGDRSSLSEIRQNVVAIGQQYGLGYPETMYRNIAAIELNSNGLRCQTAIDIPARWGDQVLAKCPSEHLLVEGNFLLNIRAVLDRPPVYEFARTKTFLKSLDLKFGLVVNFGKKQLQIYGVDPD